MFYLCIVFVPETVSFNIFAVYISSIYKVSRNCSGNFHFYISTIVYTKNVLKQINAKLLLCGWLLAARGGNKVPQISKSIFFSGVFCAVLCTYCTCTVLPSYKRERERVAAALFIAISNRRSSVCTLYKNS